MPTLTPLLGRAGLAVLTLVLAVPVVEAGSSSAPKAAGLAELAWIAGDWRHQEGVALSQEVWTAPFGDSMQGMWRHVRDGRTGVFEVLAIVQEPDGPVFLLRHFGRDFTGWEEKAAPIRLPLQSWSAAEAVFAGTGSDGAALRLTYRRVGEDRLETVVEHGEKRLEFRFERAP